MKKHHKSSILLIFIVVFSLCYFFKANMTVETSQSLITFSSIIFGFYMTSIAILYNSKFTKELYKKIDDKQQTRWIYILRSYLKNSGYCLIFSIISILIYDIFILSNNYQLYFYNIVIDINQFVSSIIFGLIAINIFFMLLMFNTIIDGIILEAKS